MDFDTKTTRRQRGFQNSNAESIQKSIDIFQDDDGVFTSNPEAHHSKRFANKKNNFNNQGPPHQLMKSDKFEYQ